jgi:hypothetical protein
MINPENTKNDQKISRSRIHPSSIELNNMEHVHLPTKP